MISYKERLPKIKTIMLDVDGVLTDNRIYMFNGEAVRSLHSKDGFILQLAMRKGFRIFIITGGKSEELKERLLGNGATEVHLRAADKLKVYEDIVSRYNLDEEEIMYMGDDIPDIPVMRRVGFSCCPQDASNDVKSLVHYQSQLLGGHGCVREIIEQILRVQSKWNIEEDYHW